MPTTKTTLTTSVSLTTDDRRLLKRKATITNHAAFSRVQVYYAQLKAAKGNLTKRFKTIKDPLNQARTRILDLEKELIRSFDIRIGEVEFEIQAWRQAEGAKAMAAAQVKAQEQAAELRTKAADLPPAEAQALETVAQALEEIPTTLAQPVLEGLHESETWRGDVNNFAALVQSVAAGRAPLDTLTPVPGKCDALAEQYKTLLDAAIPGLTARLEKGLRRNAR